MCFSKSDPKVVVIRDEMSDNACSIKINVLIMAKKAINCFNDTKSISRDMV